MPLTIPSSMYAWRKHRGNADPVWEEVPVPSTPPTGFLCKMIASGGRFSELPFRPILHPEDEKANILNVLLVCHSDHSLLTNDKQRPWFQEKYTLGHEGCGEIIKIGQRVQDTRFKIGDKIALLAVPGCGQDACVECSRDLAQLCQHGHHSGIGQDGFYAPYAAIDVRGAVPLPQNVTPSAAAVATDAVTTAYHAITRRGKVTRNETVFLFGLGGLGFNALQIIKHIGARVIVSDIRQERLDAAARLGIPREDLVPAGSSVQDFIRERGLENKIDTVLDFVGTHQTFEDAQQIVRIAGKLVCIGTLDLENTVHMKIGIRKRLSIVFSYGGQLRDLEDVLALIAMGAIEPYVEDMGLDDFPRVLKDLCDGKIKGRIALLQKQDR
ncbi:hypothetical protein LTR84_004456 [Exophiala bonariae]|uniref:Enoyl reductase (ER) domain-containing protein n=1 Tax=Exophiala bonariae TaxID=1690606 RepID=A0AAV9N879_9EURO|nr:hypothetical protein LTR84_004456 [Exophiala bonariae]